MFSLSFLLEVREEKAHLRECLLLSSLLRTQIGVPLLLFGWGCLHFTDSTSGQGGGGERARGGVSERGGVCETETGWIPLFLWHSTGAHSFI